MRKFTRLMFLISCLALFSGNLLAQWTSRTLPSGATINKVLPYNATTAFIVGASNAIYRTTNSGASWEAVTVNVPAGCTYNIMDIDFYDENNGFAVTAAGKDADNVTVNGIILKTTDKGVTWNVLSMSGFSDGSSSDITDPTLATSTGLAINSVHCSTNAIYASLKWTGASKALHSYVFKSSNLGASWAITTADMSAVNINSIESVVDTLYIGGSAGTFKVSRNGGTDWTDYSNFTAYTSVNDLRLISSDSVFLCTTNGVFLTPNYGATTTQLSAEGSFDIVNIGGVDLLFTGGSTNYNKRSLNAGSTWQLANTGLQAKSLFDLTLFNDSIYGCSTTGLLFSVHKDQIKDPVAEFSSVVSGGQVTFTNSSQNCGTYSWNFGNTVGTSALKSPIYTYSSYGTFTVQLTSSNAVTTSAVQHDVVINKPVVDFTYTIADGNNVTFTNTSQYCQTYSWNMGGIATLTTESPIFAFPALGTFDVTLTANNGIEQKSVTKQVTIDSVGLGWTYTICGNQNLQKLWAIDNQNAVVVGNSTTIFRTSDGGASWLPATVNGSIGLHTVNDLVFFDDNTGFASYSVSGTVNGFILKTTDKGATWSALELTLFSDNSGNAAVDPVAGQKVHFYAMAKTSSTVGYVVARWQDATNAYHGYVYKTTDAGATWAKASADIYQSFTYTGVANALVFDATGQNGYLAGNKFLLKTTDGAQNWTSVGLDAYGFINEVLVKDASNVFLATGNGTFKTTDGFTTYTKVATEYSFDIVEIAENTYLTGKDAATLKISRDNGVTWEEAGAGMTSSFFELAMFNNKIYGLGAAGKMHIIYIDFYSIPVAAFTSSVADKVVTFTNSSTKATSYVWNFGDSNTSTETSPVYTYSNYGTYTVTLVAKNICHAREASHELNVVNTGVNELSTNGMGIWPNPVTNGNLTVALEDGVSAIRTVSILDVQGRVVYVQNIGASRTNLQVDLNPALYLVKVETMDGSVMMQKIVVR